MITANRATKLLKKVGEKFISPALPQPFPAHLMPDQGTISYPLDTPLTTGTIISRSRDSVRFLITAMLGNKVYGVASVERLNITASLSRNQEAPRDSFGRVLQQEPIEVYSAVPLAFVRRSIATDNTADRLRTITRAEFLCSSAYQVLPGDTLRTPAMLYTVRSVSENTAGVLNLVCET